MRACQCQWQVISQQAHDAYSQGRVDDAAKLYRHSFELSLILKGDNLPCVTKSLMDCFEFGGGGYKLQCLEQAWRFFTTLPLECIPDDQVGKIIETAQWTKLKMLNELEQAQAHIRLEKTWQNFLRSLICRLH